MGLHLNFAMTMIFHCVSSQRREGEGLDKGRWKNYSPLKFSTGISGIIMQSCTFNQKGRKNERKLQLKLEPISEVHMKRDNSMQYDLTVRCSQMQILDSNYSSQITAINII